jgi:hypothetical protein
MSTNWPLWWCWWLPQPKPTKDKDIEELIRAWDKHFMSTQEVAQRAARNAEEAAALNEGLRVLKERMRCKDDEPKDQ